MSENQPMRLWEIEEQGRMAKISKLHDFAKSLGSSDAIFNDHLVFKTWQDTLDFQELCKESGLEVRVNEPPAKPKNQMRFMEEYYHVYPK